jgi:hypothetical protein
MLKYVLLGINVIGYGVAGVMYGLLIKIYPQDYRDNQGQTKDVPRS